MDTPRVEADEVIATELLEHRTPRVRNPGAEAHAMDDLRFGVAGSPRTLLQKLSDVALQLCDAQSAGVSLLEEAENRRVCRWYAVSGEYQPFCWSTLPCALSPCGTMLDRRQPLLLIDPQRYFAALERLRPRIAEALLVPFAVHGETVGTVWVVSHDPARIFDAEDCRVLGQLAAFAAAAYERLGLLGPDDLRELSRMHRVPDPEVREEPGEAG